MPPSPGTVPGACIGSGCDADIFEFGPTALLRRPRDGRDISEERAIMQYVYDNGFPVPRVFTHDDPSVIVMERVFGPLMRDDLSRRPWLLCRHANNLASLACQLGDLHAPDWLTSSHGAGDSVVHLDLSAGNVIISKRGPVVIDWGNARRGGRRLDAAYTWLCWKSSAYSGTTTSQFLKRIVRTMFLGIYVRSIGFTDILTFLDEAARFRFSDPTLGPSDFLLTKKILAEVTAG